MCSLFIQTNQYAIAQLVEISKFARCRYTVPDLHISLHTVQYLTAQQNQKQPSATAKQLFSEVNSFS